MKEAAPGGTMWRAFKYAQWMLDTEVFTSPMFAEHFKVNRKSAWAALKMAVDSGFLLETGRVKKQGAPMQFEVTWKGDS